MIDCSKIQILYKIYPDFMDARELSDFLKLSLK